MSVFLILDYQINQDLPLAFAAAVIDVNSLSLFLVEEDNTSVGASDLMSLHATTESPPAEESILAELTE